MRAFEVSVISAELSDSTSAGAGLKERVKDLAPAEPTPKRLPLAHLGWPKRSSSPTSQHRTPWEEYIGGSECSGDDAEDGDVPRETAEGKAGQGRCAEAKAEDGGDLGEIRRVRLHC